MSKQQDQSDSHQSEGLNLSHFSMWRAVVALVHVDGKVTDEEKAVIHRMTANLNLSTAQRITLDQDLEHGIVLEKVLDHITDHRDFSQLVKTAKSIFMADHEFDESEQETFNFLKREFARRFPAYGEQYEVRGHGGLADYTRGVGPGTGVSSVFSLFRHPLIRYVLMGAITMALLYSVLMRRLSGLKPDSIGDLCPVNMSEPVCQAMMRSVFSQCQVPGVSGQNVDADELKKCITKAKAQFIRNNQ